MGFVNFHTIFIEFQSMMNKQLSACPMSVYAFLEKLQISSDRIHRVLFESSVIQHLFLITQAACLARSCLLGYFQMLGKFALFLPIVKVSNDKKGFQFAKKN